MNSFKGKSLSWLMHESWIELELHHAPANEMGTAMLGELEQFAANLDALSEHTCALIIYSTAKNWLFRGRGFARTLQRRVETRWARAHRGRPEFSRTHSRGANKIDAAPLTTIAAVHGVCFGGGFELALVCDLIVADKMARFCFPELRLGLVPGFGGIPRLKRDLGNAIVRDLLLTGRSFNAQKCAAVGLVSQVAGEGESLRVARATAAQIAKFDRGTSIAAKKFIKPIPHEDFRREIDLFCELFARPAVMEGLRKFVESTDAMPYLP